MQCLVWQALGRNREALRLLPRRGNAGLARLGQGAAMSAAVTKVTSAKGNQPIGTQASKEDSLIEQLKKRFIVKLMSRTGSTCSHSNPGVGPFAAVPPGRDHPQFPRWHPAGDASGLMGSNLVLPE